MPSTVRAALKTGRQLAQTAGLVGVIFGLPALMAGGVVLPDLVPPQAVEWMGNGGTDSVVTLTADQLTLESRVDGDGTTERKPAEGTPDGDIDAGKAAKASSPEPAQNETASTSRRSRTAAKAPAGNRGVRDAVQERPRGNRGVSAGSSTTYSEARKARMEARGRRCAQPMDGITHLYGDRYVVEREVIRRYSSLEAAYQLALVDWSRDSRGKIQGFEIKRTPCMSPLFQVDIRTGDVIHAINGREIRSLPDAYTAVRKLKRKDALQVDLSRNGRRMTRLVTVQ